MESGYAVGQLLYLEAHTHGAQDPGSSHTELPFLKGQNAK